jgi:hypothetical protein
MTHDDGVDQYPSQAMNCGCVSLTPKDDSLHHLILLEIGLNGLIELGSEIAVDFLTEMPTLFMAYRCEWDLRSKCGCQYSCYGSDQSLLSLVYTSQHLNRPIVVA